VNCHHCGQPASGPADAQGRRFCCPACRLVFEAIHQAGLEHYYQRRQEPPGRPPDPPRPEETAWLNRPEVQTRYTRPRGEWLEADLLLEGMHCAACAWLVERGLSGLAGVGEARVNYATQQLQVRWEPSRVGLGDIAARVAALGYRVLPADPAGPHQSRTRTQRQMLLRLGLAGCAAGNIMLLATALYAGAGSDLEEPYRSFFHQVSWFLATPVLFYSAAPFLRGAWNGLRLGAFSMDIPISTGILVTYLYSAWATLTGGSEVYFDTMASFVFVLLVGRYLEGSSRQGVAGALERLLALGPRTAVLRTPEGRRPVAVEELRPGDRVEVPAGCRIPVDGVVLEGCSWVDEAPLTGESTPVSRGPGSRVLGGSLCQDGLLLVEARRTGADTVLARIARRVREAQSRQAPVQRLADRAARVFVLVTLAMAALSLVLWWPRGPEKAVMVATSVLIITCPCALGLATPLAVAVATGRAAARGILFRGGDVLEAARSLTHVIFDKTGTLTEGRPRLGAILPAPGQDPQVLLGLAAALERPSVHPLGRALAEAWGEGPLPEVEDFRSHPGRGVSGAVAGRQLALGTLDFAGGQPEEGLAARAREQEEKGHTVVWLAEAGRILGAFTFSDTLRAEAPEVVAALRQRGLSVWLLSGDRPGAVGAVAARLGLDGWQARLLPEDKEQFVRHLQARGARVAFVGDGVNDAPALAAARVGVAVASGSDVSVEAADLVLLRAGLQPLVEALDLARATFATIGDNLILSALYNLLAIPTAMAGWVAPVLAAVAMPLSSLLVVASSLRLGRPPRAPQPAPEGKLQLEAA
jgi:Cu2+-exporting ATPase